MSLQPIRARLLGPVDLRAAGAPIVWQRRDARALLLLLIATPGHQLRRDEVLERLWPDGAIESARNSLYKALHSLRRALEPDLRTGRDSTVILVQHETIGINPEANIWIDIDRFETLLRQANGAADPFRPLTAALDLYRGPLLASESGVEWAHARQVGLTHAWQHAILRLAEIERERGAGSTSIGWLNRLLADDPFVEDAHRALLRAFVASGQVAAAREHLAWARTLFEQELGVSLEIDDAEIFPIEKRPIIRAERSRVLGLPGLPTETLGRDQEISTIAARLTAPGSRVITLTGPGGTGKTRVAIEIARRSLSHFPGGTIFVDLTAIEDHSLLFAAIGQTLGLGRQPSGLERPAVTATLRRMRRCLLVLDNLEHLRDVSRDVAGILEDVPDICILATSRVPLRIRAEIQYPIDPFSIPEDADRDQLMHNPAVQLFLQRSADWHALGAATDRFDIEQVARLCRYLDGLPLAIELAASRANELNIGQLIENASARFEYLGSGPLDLPDRQRTLEATVAWSCRLLSDEQLDLFTQLGLFIGGADLEAVTAIAGETPARSADDLVEQHLARWSGSNGRRRLTQLETMRSYSRLLLLREGRLPELRLRHARYFADVVSRGRKRRPTGLEQVEFATLLERESANIHRALSSALDLGEGALAATICAGMGVHWFTYGPAAAALRWIDRTLEVAGEASSDDVAWTALWGAAIAWQLGDLERVEQFERDARRIWEQLGSTVGLARLEHVSAQRIALAGDHEAALQQHWANLAVFEKSNETEGIVFSRAGAADALVLLGRDDEILNELETALEVARAAGDYYLQSHVLMRLPGALLDRGELDRAERLSLEAERVSLLVRDRLALPWAAVMRAWIAWERGNDEAAIELGRMAVDRYREAGNGQNEIHGIVPVVAGMNRSGDPEVRFVADVVLRNLIEMPNDLMLGLGLPPIAETLWRFGAVDEARMVLAGGEQAAAQAAVPSHGVSTRYRTLVRRKIDASEPARRSIDDVDPDRALDIARDALGRLS